MGNAHHEAHPYLRMTVKLTLSFEPFEIACEVYILRIQFKIALVNWAEITRLKYFLVTYL